MVVGFTTTGAISASISSSEINITWTRPAIIHSTVNGSYKDIIRAELLTNNIETW
jgi:hypothetical protein